MNMITLVLGLAAIGFASGLRTFTPLALICWVAVWGWTPLGGSRLAFLGTNVGAMVVSFLAVGELIGDKLPMIPSRLSAGPIGARLVTGALAGAALCIGFGQSWTIGVVCGALASLTGAYAGFHARQAIVRRLHVADWIVAIVEDLVTIGLVLGAFAILL